MMLKRCVSLTNPEGLHLRVCAAIVETVGRFQAKVTIQKDEVAQDGASILGLMTLAAAKGTELTILANGPDSQEALQSLVELLNSL